MGGLFLVCDYHARMARRSPYRIPLFVIAAGLGLAIYYGDQWRGMPPLPKAELDTLVEQRLGAILERRGPHLSPIEGERLQQLRGETRQEIVVSEQQPRREAQYRTVAGLIVTIIGFGNLMLVWQLRRRAGD